MFRRLSSRKMDPIAVTNADDPRTYWSIYGFSQEDGRKAKEYCFPSFFPTRYTLTH